MMSQIPNVLVGVFSQWASVFIFLFVILMIQRKYLKELNRLGGRPMMLIPAALFVPVHELSHALMAILMGHKVKRIIFFQMTNAKTLGYVEHAYTKSIFSPFSNMLIGMAPLVGGGISCYWITYWFMPSLLSFNYVPQGAELITLTDIANTAKVTVDIMQLHWGSMGFWLWLFLIVNAATFNVPSGADFNGAKGGVMISLGLYLFLSYYSGSALQINAIARGVLVVIPFLIIIALSGGLIIAILALINKILGRASE